MSLRIPLTRDQTLQTEFHEIERRLRRIERKTGVSATSPTNIQVIGGSSGAVNLTGITSRLEALEAAIASLPEFGEVDIPVFGGVGSTSAQGLVPAPGIASPPDGFEQHVLVEDATWGFPFRGLVKVATSGTQTDIPYDVLDINAGLQVGHITAADIECFNLHTHGDIEYADAFWDDLKFPAAGFNPAGSTAPPGVDTATGLLYFSGTVDNVIGGVAQMPHEWKEGSIVYPHIHLRFPTSAAANTRWRFEYDIANVNGDFTNAAGTYTTLSTITVANPQNVNRHVIGSFGALPMSGFTLSAVIVWRITRLAASDAADNDISDAALIEFDIHYEIDSPGSSAEYTK